MTSIVSSSINNILSSKNKSKFLTSAINNVSYQTHSLDSYIVPVAYGYIKLVKPLKIKDRYLYFDECHDHLVFNKCCKSDENNIIADLNYLKKCKPPGELNIKDPTLSGNIYVDGIIKNACFNKGKFYNSTFNNISFAGNNNQKTYSINCLKNVIDCVDTKNKRHHIASSLNNKYSDICFPNGINIGNKWRLIVDKYDTHLLVLQYFDKSGIWLTKTTFSPE